MSQIHLTSNQRELVKFFRSYVLSLQKKKVTRLQTSEFAPSLLTSHVNPADETLLQFMPDKDPIDKRLFDNIIEPDTKKKLNRPLSVSADSKKSKTASDLIDLGSEENPDTDLKEDEDLIVSSSSEEDDEDDDVGDLYKVGGKRGFQSNIDDFLQAFETRSTKRQLSQTTNLGPKQHTSSPTQARLIGIIPENVAIERSHSEVDNDMSYTFD